MWFIYSLGLLSGNAAAPHLLMVNFKLLAEAPDRSSCSCACCDTL